MANSGDVGPIRAEHRLALRPKEAAQALGIGVRLLWSLTNQGLIPHARLGRAIVYPVDSLRTYLAEQCRNGGKR
jgi:predicted DNA-binding transcriptional regulator AlpA